MFERLTNPKHGGIRSMRLPLSNQAEIYQRLAAYEDSGLSPEDCTAYAKGEAEKRIVVFENYERLREIRELMQAKADGRLVVLPCKVDNEKLDEILKFCSNNG